MLYTETCNLMNKKKLSSDLVYWSEAPAKIVDMSRHFPSQLSFTAHGLLVALWLVHTADVDETKLSCLVELAV